MKYSVVARTPVPTSDKLDPVMILFPVDLAGPLSAPPLQSTKIQSDSAVSYGNQMSEDEIVTHVSKMREQKRVNLFEALGHWDKSVSGREVAMMIPSSIMMASEGIWDFIYPELIASLFYGVAPQKVFIDIGTPPFPFERVTLVVSKYLDMMSRSSSSIATDMIFKARDVADLENPEVYLIVSSTFAKEVKEWIGTKPNIHVAPFLVYDLDIDLQLLQMKMIMGDDEWMPVIADVPEHYKPVFHELIGKNGDTIPVMWSEASMKGIDFTKQWYQTVPVTANGASILWERKTRNSKTAGAIDPGQKMDIRIINIDGDECWAQVIDKDSGKSLGYYLWKFQGQEKVTFLD